MKEPSTFILMLLGTFASVSAVLFTPALPQIAHILHISEAMAQLTITLYLIGYAIGNLPYGPLSNRLGRKPTLFIGIIIALIGNGMMALLPLFPSFGLLLVGRFLNALGASVGLKIAFTMIGDIYSHEKATKKISFLMLAFAMGPGLAIVLGGILTTYAGWTSNFYFLIFYSLLLLALSTQLPETCQKIDKKALQIDKILEGYGQKFKNRRLMLCACLMGCGTAVIYLFAAAAPFIGIEQLGFSPEKYGFLNFIPPLGMVIGSFFAIKLAGKQETLATMKLGISIALGVSALMFFLFVAGMVNLWTLFIPMPFLYIGEALVFANASSLALSHAQNKSNASAVMNFVNLGLSFVILSLFGLISFPASYLIPLVFFLLTLVMLFLRFRLEKLPL